MKKKPWILTSSQTERKRFAEMSKEDRLKVIGRLYIGIGFSFGKAVGAGLKEKKDRAKWVGWENLFKKTIGREFTQALKKALVLPIK